MPKFNPSAIARRLARIVEVLPWRRQSKLQPGSPNAEARDRELVFGLSQARVPNSRQLRYLSTVLEPSEKRWLRFWTTIGLLALVGLGGRWAYRHMTWVADEGGTFSEAIVGAPQYLNPVLAYGSTVDQSLTGLLFRGLTSYDRNLTVKPNLAESLTTSPDGKTVTVKLRPNLKWSDGEAITSKDVVYTYTTIADPDYKSPLFPLWQTVTVDAPDTRTAVFHLPKANPAFPALLTNGLLPEHVWSDATPSTFALAETNLKPVSNGPYKFQSLTKDRDGTIRSYTFVHDKNAYGTKPYLGKIVIKFYADQLTASDAFKKDAVDAWAGITRSQVKALTKSHTVTSTPISQLVAVFFNQKTNNALKVKEVRTALGLVVDRRAIVKDALNGYGQSIVGPILQGYPGYQAAIIPPANLGAAQALLDQAGWKVNANGIRQNGKQLLTFVFTTLDDPAYTAVAKQLVISWKALGAQVELKTISVANMQKDVIKPRQYEALLFGQVFENDGDPYPYWDSSQSRDPGYALSIFANKKIDQAVEDARGQADAVKREADLKAFQVAIADEVPAIFLYQNVSLDLHNKNLRGLDGARLISTSDRFMDVAHWYIKTKLGWRAKK